MKEMVQLKRNPSIFDVLSNYWCTCSINKTPSIWCVISNLWCKWWCCINTPLISQIFDDALWLSFSVYSPGILCIQDMYTVCVTRNLPYVTGRFFICICFFLEKFFPKNYWLWKHISLAFWKYLKFFQK